MWQVVSECTKMEMSQAHIVHVFMLLAYEFNQLKTVNPRSVWCPVKIALARVGLGSRATRSGVR
jgi:hypothetical protein